MSPLYEYSCSKCGVRFEIILKISDIVKKVICPKCKSECIRVPSTSSFRLKGKGWYKTDYKGGK